jgi:creatinine amidohydrolase
MEGFMQKPRTYRLDLLNWQEVKKLVPDQINGVILPVGTIEAHGATGLGTDSILAEKISDRMAAKLNCIVAPTINYGITNTLLPYPGSHTVTSESFINYTMDVMIGLSDIGFSRVIVMNGHGGQEKELKELVTDFNKITGVKVILFQWWYFVEEALKKVYGSDVEGGHAGLEETAMMMALCEEGTVSELFKEELISSLPSQIRAIPAPGTILQDSQAPPPNFDKVKAEKFADMIIEEVVKHSKNIFKQWDEFFD